MKEYSYLCEIYVIKEMTFGGVGGRWDTVLAVLSAMVTLLKGSIS